MDPDDLILAAFGVLLTQVRTARRALEDVQRATSRYMGLEFAKALTEGPRFGAPPMHQGALMVHIVNINDLAPGNTFGGFIEALLGGVGSFFGNLIGGVGGGFLAGRALPEMIARLERITQNVQRIMDRLGIGGDRSQAQQPQSAPQAQAQSGESFISTLDGLRGTIRDVTALFQAAQGGPGDTGAANRAGRTSQTPLSSSGERWMAILDGVNRLLDRTAQIVDGLIIAIPLVIGSIALLVVNLASIRRALLETIQFLLRNALILRGVLLTVIFETVAAAARLAAAIVGMLGTAIQGILTAIVAAVQALIAAVFDALRTLTTALQAVVRTLLEWMVTGIFNTLRAIGELSVFRTIDHLIRILPAMLPAIFMLMNTGKELPANVMTLLENASRAGLAGRTGTGTGGTGAGTGTGTPTPTATVTIGAFPDLTTIINPLATSISGSVTTASTELQRATESAFGTARGALTGIAGRFEGAVEREADFSRGVLDRHGERIRSQSAQLADAISAPLGAQGPASTGLEEIATAYQRWLTGGGMNALLGEIGTHFRNAPARGEPGGPLRLLRGQFDRPRATIDIDRVEIVIEPPAEEPQRTDTTEAPVETSLSDEEIYNAVARYARELEDRGIRHIDSVDFVA